VRRHFIDRLSPEQLDALAGIAESVLDHLREHRHDAAAGPRGGMRKPKK
jgi:ribosomal protein S15P/S13E